MQPRDYKERAREMLSGKYPFSVIYYICGALLGSALAGALITHPAYFAFVSVPFNKNILPRIPESLNFIVYGILLYTILIEVLRIAQLMVGGMVDLGVARYTLNLHDGHPTRIRTLFSQANNFTNACVLFYFRKIVVVLKTLILIAPGIVAHYEYAMTQFIMCDYPDMTARQAMAESKELMNGHKMELFKLDLSFIGWHILCIATLGVGYIFLRPYMVSAKVAFYRELYPTEMIDQ